MSDIDPQFMRQAAELLQLGPGCRDGACQLGALPGQHTNGGCKCLAYTPEGTPRKVPDRIALRVAVVAAAGVLQSHAETA